MDSKNSQKLAKKKYCELCDYITCKKCDFDKHVLTTKHIKMINDSKMIVEQTLKCSKIYECDCGKHYKYDSGYYRHKKICKIGTKSISNLDLESVDTKDLIMMLIKENSSIVKENSEFKNMLIEQSKETSEFKNLMMEVIKNGTLNTNISNTNISNTNSHNKAFNLNFFLNETCKNAMNITEFADSIKLQLSDFEHVGDVGFITGISNIIIKNLKALDITQRPVHCTDQKRETIYIKDEDKWEKEDEKKQKCHKFIKKIVNKNQRLLLKFQEVYPDYNKYSSPNSTRYDLIVIEALGGRGDNITEKEDKILSNISKTICVNKDTL